MFLKRTLVLLTLVLVTAVGGRLAAAPLPEFNATYRVEKSGMAGRMVMTLKRDGDLWRFESRSEPDGLLTLFDAAYVSETSVLEQQPTGLRPITYNYNAKRKPSERDVASVFDWKNGTLSSQRGSKSRSVELHPGTFDRLSVLLGIIAELRTGATRMQIPVVSKGKVRTREFVLEGEETIEVRAGSFKTVRVRELRGSSKRHTVSWFAPEHHFLPVRTDQFRKDKHIGRAELIEVSWPDADASAASQ